ncbi:family 2 encapsulin nanocompartment cargo protein terpene cyclase [Nocardia amamiensis]|uniref:family 2 encapsulin nanocompartment cargo protein terpene cyclase n=1 Tax=Nocardia amamiensis TaxID=404578 RepID=UPI000A6A3ED4|nr:family 2 encapsulin nanocompartment cargo protein terpene cyclase [Nocardia amamiensis]
MSVLSRAAAAKTTDELAATVAALLTNTGTTAPRALFPAEAVVSLADSPSPQRAGAAPRALLGPSGLGAAALLLPLRGISRATQPGSAAQTDTPGSAASSAPSAAVPDGDAPGAVHTTGTAGGMPLPPAPRIPSGPTGLGTASALHGLRGVSSPARAVVPPVFVAPGGRAEPKPASNSARVPRRPTEPDTATTDSDRQDPIPPLYCPPPLRDDPALAAAVNEGIVDWAAGIGLYEGRLDTLRDADFGRLIMLAHPDCDDPDRLLAVAKCAVSEWSVDDYYCEEDADDRAPDGTPSSAVAELGPRLELAAAAMDPVHLPARYQAQLEAALDADPILRAFRTSFAHLARYASPAQLARLRTEIAGWFIALGAEAGWRAAGRMPPVWEYLTNRQPHSFLPCMAPTDVVGGYELGAAEYTDPAVRRVVTTAALASQMVNDLYSMAREDLSGGREFNLPTVLAAEERCSRREAVLRTAEVHDELVHRFEREAAPLATAGSPELGRFLAGLWAWMGGNRAWHADSKRYRDPH